MRSWQRDRQPEYTLTPLPTCPINQDQFAMLAGKLSKFKSESLGSQGVLMAKILGLVAALTVFSAWLSVVGNPHVVETVIGLVLAATAGFWVFFKARKFGAPPM
jgi:hypothetical protein